MSHLAFRTAVIVASAVAIAASAAFGQDARPAPGMTLRCVPGHASRDTLGRRALPRGYTITISRAPDTVEEACIATLRGPDGRVVRADSGFGVAVNRATGMDVDEDGTPELVLEIDTGGGKYCCWNYTAVSLAVPARLLFQFHWVSTPEFRRDARGGVTLWSWEGGLFGTENSMATRLFGTRVYRFAGGRLTDITAGQCASIDAETDTVGYRAKPPDADARRRLATFGPASDSAYGIATAIESLMLQEVFCRRFDRALAMANTMWPAATRGEFVARFRDMVVSLYPEYAAAMRDWR